MLVPVARSTRAILPPSISARLAVRSGSCLGACISSSGRRREAVGVESGDAITDERVHEHVFAHPEYMLGREQATVACAERRIEPMALELRLDPAVAVRRQARRVGVTAGNEVEPVTDQERV